jgi:hypothetical protein
MVPAQIAPPAGSATSSSDQISISFHGTPGILGLLGVRGRGDFLTALACIGRRVHLVAEVPEVQCGEHEAMAELCASGAAVKRRSRGVNTRRGTACR